MKKNELKEKKILEVNSMNLMPFTYFVIIYNIILKKLFFIILCYKIIRRYIVFMNLYTYYKIIVKCLT